ncbi:hypothetical protein [Klebsiella quasipneumoniae]|uniref:hypothetical protein n=1 Tax=Klebsiella quasipneumoniae TaxID=1463165 RepID=UPI002DB9E80B|nr:hypothetical protein [Klebsiella quasipneumoniae]MEB6582666.1 hypothetical protein [Klebsiella quasipneumoniae]
MTVDVDGAPNAYGPDDKMALDYKQDAYNKDSKTVVGYLVDKNSNPFIQGGHDPAPGFYISITRYSDVKNKNDSDPRKYVNAAEINYTVLASSAATKGVKYGDFVLFTLLRPTRLYLQLSETLGILAGLKVRWHFFSVSGIT